MKLRFLLFFFVLLLVGCTTSKEITVSFESNGGEQIEAIQTTSNTSLSLPNPIREGYEFLGWYNEENVLTDSPALFQTSTTLYAKWGLETYTVRFVDNEENLISTAQVTMNQTVVFPLPPQKENLVFARWEPAVTKTTEDVTIHAVYTAATDGLQYTLEDDHYVVSGYEGSTSEVIIPDMIAAIPVTTIGSLAFAGNSLLTSIVLPDSITKIEDRAFYEAGNLAAITFSSALETIGTEAFYNCFYLTSITVPAVTIGESAFYGCSNLADIHPTDRVTTILSWAFLGCSDLVTVVIPSSVAYIGNHIFSWCQKLDFIYTPSYNLSRLQTMFSEVTHIYTHFTIAGLPQ